MTLFTAISFSLHVSRCLCSKILGLDVPVMKKLPPLRDEVKERQSGTDVHLWLCYW